MLAVSEVREILGGVDGVECVQDESLEETIETNSSTPHINSTLNCSGDIEVESSLIVELVELPIRITSFEWLGHG